jgi:hypothetical protein
LLIAAIPTMAACAVAATVATMPATGTGHGPLPRDGALPGRKEAWGFGGPDIAGGEKMGGRAMVGGQFTSGGATGPSNGTTEGGAGHGAGPGSNAGDVGATGVGNCGA